MTIPGTRNPRNLREKYQAWTGKKVIVGLTTFHYLSGHWKAFDGYYVVFDIGGTEHRVLLDEIDSVAEAPAALAEYFK